MSLNKVLVLAMLVMIVSCGGGGLNSNGNEGLSNGAGEISSGRDSGISARDDAKAVAPEAALPSDAVEAGGGGEDGKVGLSPIKPGAVSVLAPAAFRGDLVLPNLPDAETVHQKACDFKYDQCMASASVGADAVEKQRVCVTNQKNCLAEPTEEAKCDGSYKSCIASLAGSEYAVEAQRGCVSSREECVATNVYPACCDNAYSACMKSIPPSANSVELQRVCVKQQEQCKARFYCE